MSYQDRWQQIAKRFDPQTLPLPEWCIERTGSPANAILGRLSLPPSLGVAHILLHGTVGTGKTTELHRIAQERAKDDLVVFLDVEGYFEALGDKPALQRVSAWEVCFLAAMSLVARAQDQLNARFDPQHLQAVGKAWENLARATSTTPAPALDVAAFTRGLLTTAALILNPFGTSLSIATAGGLVATSAVLDGVKDWKVPAGKAKQSLGDQAAEIQHLLNAVNVLIGEVQRNHKRVLFIVDGLDRIRDLDRAAELFVESTILLRLIAPIVVTAPLILRNHTLRAGIEGWRSEVLVNEPVVGKLDPKEKGPGVPVMRKLFQRRVSDLGPDHLSEEQIDRLAIYSGGRAREFVILVREVALQAFVADVARAEDGMIDEAIEFARRHREAGLHRGHIAVLEEVMRDVDRRMPSSDLTANLLATFALLPYPNKSEWFYPHPLLTLSLLHP